MENGTRAMTKTILITLLLVGQVFANKNIICKENNNTDSKMADSKSVCQKSPIVDFYSNQIQVV